MILKHMGNSWKSRWTAIALATSSSMPVAIAQQPQRIVDNNPERIRQAQQIIDENKEIVKQSNLFIAQAKNQIDEAHKLHGEARQYQSGLHINAPLLKGKALQDAKRQFDLDLSQFQNHVRHYNLHTLEVRKNYGSCKASLAAYEKMKKDLALHCDEFHMKDVEPPHICKSMDMSVQEATQLQSKAYQQAKRVAEAEHELAKTEMRLQKAVSERGIIDKEVMEKSALALKEQDLAEEFGRLKEEHRQLEVERKILSKSGAKITVPTVKGKVR